MDPEVPGFSAVESPLDYSGEADEDLIYLLERRVSVLFPFLQN